MRDIIEAAKEAGLYKIGAPMHVWQGDTTHLTKFADIIRRDAIPEGYALVPVEPTKAMRLASNRYKRSNKITTGIGFYRAMVAAAQEGSE